MKLQKTILIVLIILSISIPTVVYGHNYYNFNKQINLGQVALESESFEDAIRYYSEALKYTKSRDKKIYEKINLINNLKEAKEFYRQGTKLLLEDKKYIEAIDIFKKVSQYSDKYYNLAQSKIIVAINLYIKDNIDLAKAKAEKNSFDEAITYLDRALKYDETNSVVLELKETYNTEIQRVKDEEARKKADEEARRKADEEAKKKAASKPKYPIIYRNPDHGTGAIASSPFELPPNTKKPYKVLFKERDKGYLTIEVTTSPPDSGMASSNGGTFVSYDLIIYLIDHQLFFKRNDYNSWPMHPDSYYVVVKVRETGQILFKYIPE